MAENMEQYHTRLKTVTETGWNPENIVEIVLIVEILRRKGKKGF